MSTLILAITLQLTGICHHRFAIIRGKLVKSPIIPHFVPTDNSIQIPQKVLCLHIMQGCTKRVKLKCKLSLTKCLVIYCDQKINAHLNIWTDSSYKEKWQSMVAWGCHFNKRKGVMKTPLRHVHSFVNC